MGCGVNTRSLHVDNNPSGDSNSLTSVPGVSGSTLTQRGVVSFRTNERLPCTVSIRLSVTVNISSELGLIPKDLRRAGGGISVDLKLASKCLGFKLNGILCGIRSSTQ